MLPRVHSLGYLVDFRGSRLHRAFKISLDRSLSMLSIKAVMSVCMPVCLCHRNNLEQFVRGDKIYVKHVHFFFKLYHIFSKYRQIKIHEQQEHR